MRVGEAGGAGPPGPGEGAVDVFWNWGDGRMIL